MGRVQYYQERHAMVNEMLNTYSIEDYKPEILPVTENMKTAVRLLGNAINDPVGNNIIIHGDVDFDGIASTYIIKKVIQLIFAFGNRLSNPNLYESVNKQPYTTINANKQHGINAEFIEKVNTSKATANVNTLIIVDSSTNNVDEIKKFNGNVIIIDHHDISEETLEKGLSGKTEGGEYVIINNNSAEFKDYADVESMSGAMLAYEVCRYYMKYEYGPNYGARSTNKCMLHIKPLCQWAAASLITDVINCATQHNMYYILKAFVDSDNQLEENLATIKKAIARIKQRECSEKKKKFYGLEQGLNKELITYNIAPFINGGIRCGMNLKVLDIALNKPAEFVVLEECKKIQEEICKIDFNIKETESYVTTCIDEIDTDLVLQLTHGKLNNLTTFTGLIASKLLDRYGKTAYVYSNIDNGKVKGSVRGKNTWVKYRTLALELGAEAEGHPGSFGLTCNANDMDNVLKHITAEDISDSDNVGLLADHYSVNIGLQMNSTGEFKILPAFEELTRNKERENSLINIAWWNSVVSSKEEIRYLLVGDVRNLLSNEDKNSDKEYKKYIFGDAEKEIGVKAYGNIKNDFCSAKLYVVWNNGRINFWLRD